MFTEVTKGDRKMLSLSVPDEEIRDCYEMRMVSECDIEGLIRPVIGRRGHGMTEVLFDITGLSEAEDPGCRWDEDEEKKEKLRAEGRKLWKELGSHLLSPGGLIAGKGNVMMSGDGKRLLFMYLPPSLRRDEAFGKVPDPDSWWKEDGWLSDVDRIFDDWGEAEEETKTKQVKKVPELKRAELKGCLSGMMLAFGGLIVLTLMLHPGKIPGIVSSPGGALVLSVSVVAVAGLFIGGNLLADKAGDEVRGKNKKRRI